VVIREVTVTAVGTPTFTAAGRTPGKPTPYPNAADERSAPSRSRREVLPSGGKEKKGTVVMRIFWASVLSALTWQATEPQRRIDHDLGIDHINGAVLIQIVCRRCRAQNLIDDYLDVRHIRGHAWIQVALGR
jgi:hypothetical protein